MLRQESAHNIETPDAKIYGRLSSVSSKKLVIHLHGMTHAMHYFLEVMGAEIFNEHGYDHYRFSFYTNGPDARHGNTVDMTTHLADTKAVINHFRGKYNEIYITGHSLAAPMLLATNPPEIKAFSLWDPAFDAETFWQTGNYLTYDADNSEYHLNYGNVFVLSKKWVDEIKIYNNDYCLDLAAQVATPTQLIIPEESIFLASPDTSPAEYGDYFTGDFDLVKIPNSDHCFSYPGNYKKLFAETIRWFEKC